MIQRQGNGSYRNSFGLQVPENFFRNGTVDLKDVEATRHLLLSEYFADWSDENKDLIRHSTDFRAWPLYTLTTEDMNWKTVSGVTVAGDAAHLAYPGGEGVNLAMIDALRLASSIVEHGVENMDEAVHGYERDMFPRAIAAIGESQAMASVMYSEDPQALIQLICS
jgi:2-polyprenyl-6-methoxyphenol hydroxylase-like FAD-dependent oxidoreductase